jgi:hypothetical protein
LGKQLIDCKGALKFGKLNFVECPKEEKEEKEVEKKPCKECPKS